MKIICIGRNYVEHARELNNEIPTEPVFFMKPDTALLQQGKPFFIPSFSNDIHYEAELVLRISKEGKNILEEFASRYYDSVAVGIDFTARDIQQRQKEKGLPWEPAKAFDGSAAVGRFLGLRDIQDQALPFTLELNGLRKQTGSTALMIFSFDKIVSFVSRYITLRKGDLVFTGTPKGVGRVSAGDSITCSLCDQESLKLDIR